MASSSLPTPTRATLHRQIPRPPPHVLFVSYPHHGHALPLFNFARLLASKAVAVTFVCVQHRISKLQRDHVGAAGLSPLIRLVGLPERVPVGGVGIDEGTGIESWLREVATEMKNDFVQLLHKLQAVAAGGVGSEECFGAPICIVYDLFLWWVRDVAASLKINHYPFSVFCASSVSLAFHLPLFISQGYLPLRSSTEPRLITLPGHAPAWDREILGFSSDTAPKDSAQWIIDCGSKLNETQTIFVNTCYELEANAIDALQKCETIHQTKINVKAVGPVLPPDLLDNNYVDLLPQGDTRKEQEDECLRWLNSRSPASVLYVSFGSICIPSFENIIELALGLEASNHAFLWVLRPPPCIASGDQSLSLSSLLPEGFESRTKDRGFIISPWAPQLLILSHPSIGGFLTHCGWNSTIESIYMGVPFIAYPQYSDSRRTSAIIVDQLKVGIRLTNHENENLRREQIEKCVKTLMEGEEGKQIKNNVRQLRDLTRRSLKEGGSTYTNLQGFVQEIFQLSAGG